MKRTASWIKQSLYRRDIFVTRGTPTHRLVRQCANLGVVDCLDIGANEGQFASSILKVGWPGSVTSVEPLTSAYADLLGAAASNPHWHVVQRAVGERDGAVLINVSGNSVSSSVLPMAQACLDAAPESAYVAQESVGMSSLDSLMDELGLEIGNTLIKVDVQGYEAQVFAGGEHVLSSTPAVLTEVSFVELYAGQSLFPEISRQLLRYGLEMWDLQPGLRDQNGRMLQADVMFVRSHRAGNSPSALV